MYDLVHRAIRENHEDLEKKGSMACHGLPCHETQHPHKTKQRQNRRQNSAPRSPQPPRNQLNHQLSLDMNDPYEHGFTYQDIINFRRNYNMYKSQDASEDLTENEEIEDETEISINDGYNADSTDVSSTPAEIEKYLIFSRFLFLRGYLKIALKSFLQFNITSKSCDFSQIF